MEYAISHSALAKIKADCVILPLSSDATLPENLPDETREAVKAFIKAGDFSGDKGQTAWLHHRRRRWSRGAQGWPRCG